MEAGSLAGRVTMHATIRDAAFSSRLAAEWTTVGLVVVGLALALFI